MKTKKTIIIITTCLLLFAALWWMWNRGTVGGSAKTVIHFWNGFTGPDGQTMLRLVKKFDKENPDVNVQMQRMRWGTYYNKLFIAGMGGRAPEVFILHASNLERFIRAKFMRTVGELLKSKDGIALKDFQERALVEVKRNDKIYAVPLDTHMLGMYYNKTLLIKAGITDANGRAKPPRNLDEFMETLRKVTRNLNQEDAKQKIWGFAFTWLRSNISTIMWQYGGSFFSQNKSECTLNSKENVKALEFCADIVNKFRYSPMPGTESDASWIEFCQGKVGLVFEGIYMLHDLQKLENFDYAAAPVPQIGKIPATWADSHVMCLRKKLSDKKLKAAWRFVKFLSDNSLDWVAGGQIPVRKNLLNDPRFAQMRIQRAFARQLPYIHYMPQVPYLFGFLDEFDIAVEKALRGTVTAQQALDTATSNVNKIIARYKQMYKSREQQGQ